MVFASAADGWAFSTQQFAGMYASRMGIKQDKLASIMWGDWAYDAKSKRAVKLKRASKLKPLFVQVSSHSGQPCQFMQAFQNGYENRKIPKFVGDSSQHWLAMACTVEFWSSCILE